MIMRACHRCLALASLLRIVLVIVVLSTVVATRPGATGAQDTSPTATEIATETATVDVSPTVAPAETPVPTSTAQPTDTPQPTATSEPTSTVEPTSSPEPTQVPTSSVTPSPTPSPTTTLRPSATSTLTANPTAETAGQEAATTTYNVTIISVDVNGDPVGYTCYDVYRDAGDGSPGALVLPDACDDFEWGITKIRLPAGSFVLVETRHVTNVGTASNRHFTVSADRSITVTHQFLTKMVITAKDNATGLPLPGACFDLTPVSDIIFPGSYLACDFDGANDGNTTIPGVDRGTYSVISYPPLAYLKPTSREVTVSTLSSPRAVTVGFDKGASLLIHKRNVANEPIAGACFRLLANNNGVPGNPVGDPFCDNSMGPDDGDVEGIGFATGSYFLRELSAPTGYLTVVDQLVSLTAPQTTQLTITDPIGGQVEIHAVDDHGDPMPDVCPAVFHDVGGGTRGEEVILPLCQTGDSGTDGVSKLIGIPAGNFLLVEIGAPLGYVPSADIPFTMTAGGTKTIQIVNAVGGTVNVTVVDSTQPATKVPGGCFSVVVDAGGGAHGPQVAYQCDGNDEPNDGMITIAGLAAGSYVLVQQRAAAFFNRASDQTFTIGLRETENLTVFDQPYGTLRIHNKTPTGADLPGSCFIASAAPGSEMPDDWVDQVACDSVDGDDGTINFKLPNGSFIIQEHYPPSGYMFAPLATASIRDAGVTEITVVDPKPSTLILNYVNVWHDPVTGKCADVYESNEAFGFNGSASACDADDGTKDGKITLKGLMWGSWEVRNGNFSPYRGWEATGVLAPGENKTVEVVLTQDPPTIVFGPILGSVTQTSATIYWETDQKTIGSVKYGLTTGFGRTAPSTPEQATKTHRINLTDLKANTLYYFQVRGTSPNGNVASKTYYFRALKSTATGKVVVTKVKSDGTSLPGACFDVYRNAGGGALGTWIRGSCDKFETDGNNGKITIAGLSAGSYVLVEFFAPGNYKLASHVLFTLTTGQTKQLKVTDVGGGVIVNVTSRIYDAGRLKGSCFTIYKYRTDGTVGDYVTNMCDDFDGEDGLTTFGGIAVGSYYLWEDYVPAGYVRDLIKKFTITSGERTHDTNYYNRSVKDTSNIVISAIDSLDRLVPGACFALYHTDSSGALGSFVKDRCDEDDGAQDGKTYLTGIDAGTYVALEYLAPKGFVAGKKTTITKVSGQLASKRIRQVTGGVVLAVTTLRGSTSTKAAGVCYGLYRYTSGHWEFVTYACDDWDGANDGVTRIIGVQPGTYRLYQTVTPPGYYTPAYVTITVGSTTKSQTVRMYPR
jgi:uncharacterized surface anchored protein